MLDLLTYGSDTVTIHQLFKVPSALDPNPVHHTSLNDLVASLRRNNMGTFIDGMTRGSKICLLAEPVDNFSLFSNGILELKWVRQFSGSHLNLVI